MNDPCGKEVFCFCILTVTGNILVDTDYSFAMFPLGNG